MTRLITRPLLVAVLLATTISHSTLPSLAQDAGGLATYRNERHGFALAYPSAQFTALPSATEDGRQFVSKDGGARLLVGTLANFDNKTIGGYRTFVLNESYPGAKVDYAPVRDTWFVVSGVRNGMAFYQRVNFTCGGRSINSWALVFPEGQKSVYEPIIDQVHRDYKLGTGNCAQRVTSADRRTL